MTEAIAQILPFAVGIMVSPIPIIAVIVMLFTRRARVNGPLFLLGWVVGLTALAIVGYLLASALDWGSGSEAAQTQTAWWRVGLGLALLVLAARKWRRSIEPDHVDEMPAWMSGLDDMRAVRALRLGLILSSVNPKNLALGLGAMTGLAAAGPTSTEAAVAIAVFVVLSSLTVLSAVLYHQLGGAKAQRTLEITRDWLSVHNDAVMAVVYLVFGVVLISNGLGG